MWTSLVAAVVLLSGVASAVGALVPLIRWGFKTTTDNSSYNRNLALATTLASALCLYTESGQEKRGFDSVKRIIRHIKRFLWREVLRIDYSFLS